MLPVLRMLIAEDEAKSCKVFFFMPCVWVLLMALWQSTLSSGTLKREECGSEVQVLCICWAHPLSPAAFFSLTLWLREITCWGLVFFKNWCI